MQTDVRVERVNVWTTDNDVFRGHCMANGALLVLCAVPQKIVSRVMTV